MMIITDLVAAAVEKTNGFFNLIAPAYGLFYRYQTGYYKKALVALSEINLSAYSSVIDIGCGTGALCSELNRMGFEVTGIDNAQNMLSVAANKPGNENVRFVQASILEKLSFEDKSFDISVASLVAHGLKEVERQKMYSEMSRITKHYVIIYDYTDKRSIPVDIIEWLEGGDYFNFIKAPLIEISKSFENVFSVKNGLHMAFYIGKPKV